jgi:predicted DNA binding CopG/RHH family protein
MLSEQLLIKLDGDLMNKVKELSGKLGLKLSTFARMALKSYVDEYLMDQQDIAVFKKHRGEKGIPYDEFLNELETKYGIKGIKKSSKGSNQN